MEQNNEAVKLSLLTQNKADVIGSQPGSLNAFLKKSSNLILSMMTEERHKKSILKAERSKTDDTRTVTDQVSVPLASPLFSAFGNIISIRTAQNCASPLFLVLHATKDNSPPVQSRFRGCVSGWNGYSPGAALFILGLLERPTCLDSFSDSDGVLLVVAGVIDGSIACWDVREPSSNAIYFDQESQIVQLPCFVSCATTPSHTESVLDIATIQPGSRASSAKFVVSLDESGIVIVWNVMHSVKEKGRNNENTGAGQTVELVRSRTIDIWRNCPKRFVITTIYSDGRSTNQAFVTSSNGHLLGVFMQSSQSTISYINTAGGGFTSLVTTMSFSQHFPGYFLVGYDNGRISLYNTAYRICLNSWSLAAAASIVGLYWSETNPKLFYSVDSKGNIGLYKLGDKISETPSQISTSCRGHLLLRVASLPV
ncbi:uncharacterized protein LOC129602652 [Paramacrobiotus metropolitanus]|uniref:uncharacterized protein LOC129602652 n=1 Tax=Paramacrobiotus metropolitanus TaxID=2943436 RepID=UPI0024458A04|nr:uncharacterized protein LOC129602652 [Paramacrobiotus metropolitanus]XP_055357710.1 uncharacterized protein LOC129602652 [Paramacrobiotus metropolitanus]